MCEYKDLADAFREKRDKVEKLQTEKQELLDKVRGIKSICLDTPEDCTRDEFNNVIDEIYLECDNIIEKKGG